MPKTNTKVYYHCSFDKQGRPILAIVLPATRVVVGGGNQCQSTHAQVMELMGIEMTLLRTSWYEMPGGSVAVWFPDMTAKMNGQWMNDLSPDGKTIAEYGSGKKNWSPPSKHFRKILRITFAKIKPRTYKYIGVFQIARFSPHAKTVTLRRIDNIVQILSDVAVTTV